MNDFKKKVDLIHLPCTQTGIIHGTFMIPKNSKVQNSFVAIAVNGVFPYTSALEALTPTPVPMEPSLGTKRYKYPFGYMPPLGDMLLEGDEKNMADLVGKTFAGMGDPMRGTKSKFGNYVPMSANSQ